MSTVLRTVGRRAPSKNPGKKPLRSTVGNDVGGTPPFSDYPILSQTTCGNPKPECLHQSSRLCEIWSRYGSGLDEAWDEFERHTSQGQW